MVCRYLSHPVKTHWACLPCHRSLKRPRGSTAPCPECGGRLIDMGRDFKAPRREARRQWAKLALMVAAAPDRQDSLGRLAPAPLFDSCGCSGPGPRPRTLADAKTAAGLRRSARRAPAVKPRTRIPRSLRYA